MIEAISLHINHNLSTKHQQKSAGNIELDYRSDALTVYLTSLYGLPKQY